MVNRHYFCLFELVAALNPNARRLTCFVLLTTVYPDTLVLVGSLDTEPCPSLV